MKHDRLSILRAQEAARHEQEKADAVFTELTGRSTRFRDDPAYAAAVVRFEARQTVKTPKAIGVDPGAPGGDITTYTLGGNGAMTATGAHLIWGSTTPVASAKKRSTAPAASAKKRSFQVGDRVRVVNARERERHLKEGMELVVTGTGPITRGERTISVDERCCYFHRESRFELVEAAGSTAPKAEEPKYWVCVKACKDNMFTWAVGGVGEGSLDILHPGCFLPCDKDGWVTHDPRPDSTCPVPDGVKFEAKCRCGIIDPHPFWDLGSPGDRTPHRYDIVAWRPMKP